MKVKRIVNCVTYVYTYFKPGVRVEVKYRPSLLHSDEEKFIRKKSLGIQNDDEALINLIFTLFVDILVKSHEKKTATNEHCEFLVIK